MDYGSGSSASRNEHCLDDRLHQDTTRYGHADLPSRPEAIRQFIILGLQAKKPE